MKKVFLSTIIFIIFISCNNEKKSPVETHSTDTTIVTSDLPPSTVSDTTIPEPATETEILQKVTYVSATYYTGRVDFYFKDEKGKTIEVGISNFPEDKGAKYPPSLLESGEDIEGPPGENPAMVGKQFYLVKDKNGKVIEIRPVK